MPGLGIVAPVSFGDATLPQLDITPLLRVPGASYDWAVDKVSAGPVATWYGMVQAGQMVAPTVASQRPNLTTDGVTGRKIMHFDGVNQRFDATLSLSGAKTLVVVGRLPLAANSSYLITGGTGPSFNLYIGSNGKFASTAGTTLASTVTADGNMHVFIFVSNGTSSVFSVDGVEVAGAAGTSTATGLRVAATSTVYAQADVQRIAVVPYAATSAQRAAILAQMKSQYGL